MLAAEGLAISVAGRRLLSDVSLALRSGERMAVMGPSGCGKTLLLRAIAGLVESDCGQLTLYGRSPREIGWPAYRRRVLYVHQKPALLDETVAACLSRPFRYASRSADFSRDRAEAALAALGLDRAVMDQAVRTLSVGEQQRVALVRALLVEPEVLLLDEVAAALDMRAVEAVETLLTTASEHDGIAMLFVTHDAGQAERFCRRMIELTQYGGSTTHAAQPTANVTPTSHFNGDNA